MDADSTTALQALLQAQPIAALGTLRSADKGHAEPHVSMVPVAWRPGSAEALIHVSALSPHTRDMQAHSRVSLMLVAPRSEGDNPLSLARLTVQADALLLGPEDAAYASAHSAYLARFSQAAQTFALGDFALLRLVPQAVRFIAGFGRAHAVALDEFTRIALQAQCAP